MVFDNKTLTFSHNNDKQHLSETTFSMLSFIQLPSWNFLILTNKILTLF